MGKFTPANLGKIRPALTLNNPVTPMQAETALQLTLAPKADTARYDRLRPTHLDDQEVRHA